MGLEPHDFCGAENDLRPEYVDWAERTLALDGANSCGSAWLYGYAAWAAGRSDVDRSIDLVLVGSARCLSHRLPARSRCAYRPSRENRASCRRV
jgi:hypothetical protein